MEYANPFEYFVYGATSGFVFHATLWYISFLWNLKVTHIDKIG